MAPTPCILFERNFLRRLARFLILLALVLSSGGWTPPLHLQPLRSGPQPITPAQEIPYPPPGGDEDQATATQTITSGDLTATETITPTATLSETPVQQRTPTRITATGSRSRRPSMRTWPTELRLPTP